MSDIIPLHISRTSHKKTKADDIDKQMYANVASKVGDMRTAKGIIMLIDGTHSGYLNGNLRKYSDESFQKNHYTFTNPFYKPHFMEHDSSMLPVGRVMDSVFIKGRFPVKSTFSAADSQTATGLVKVGIWVPDSSTEYIQKVRDNMILTTSVGFKSSAVKCSICGFDLQLYMKTGEVKRRDGEKEPCDHEPGNIYNKKLAYLDVDIEKFNEISAVNNPADTAAKVNSYMEMGYDFLNNSTSSKCSVQHKCVDTVDDPILRRFIGTDSMIEEEGSTADSAELFFSVDYINYGKTTVVDEKTKDALNNKENSEDSMSETANTEDLSKSIQDSIESYFSGVFGDSSKEKSPIEKFVDGLNDKLDKLDERLKAVEDKINESGTTGDGSGEGEEAKKPEDKSTGEEAKQDEQVKSLGDKLEKFEVILTKLADSAGIKPDEIDDKSKGDTDKDSDAGTEGEGKDKETKDSSKETDGKGKDSEEEPTPKKLPSHMASILRKTV